MLQCALVSLSLLVAIGCNSDASRTSGPLASGRIISVTYWEKPVAHEGSNSGNSPAEGSLVDLYDGFIIIRQPNGRRIVSPHGWYTNLVYEDVK